MLNAWQAKQLLDGRTEFNLGPYLIVDSIGQGGMGQVFKARHEKMGRIVAVKVLPRDKSTPEAVANFTREIRALAKLDHPRLVAALDAGEDGSVHYLVTEYVPGIDLRKLVRREGPLSMSAAASIICQVAEGLEYAHAQGIIHRDVKPGNVLVSLQRRGEAFRPGACRPLERPARDGPAVRQNRRHGRLPFARPSSRPVEPHAGLGHLLVGLHALLRRDGQGSVSGRHDGRQGSGTLRSAPLDPRRLNPRLSPEFVEIMADMMAKDPAQRIASPGEVIRRLTPFVGGPPAAAGGVAAGDCLAGRRRGSSPSAAVDGRPAAGNSRCLVRYSDRYSWRGTGSRPKRFQQ